MHYYALINYHTLLSMEKKSSKQSKIKAEWKIPKLSIQERCYNFFNIMIDLNFVNSIFWTLFAFYEYFLWIAMPIMGAETK